MLDDPKLISELYKLVFLENRPKEEVISVLRLQGWTVTDKEYSTFRKKAFTVFKDETVKLNILDNFVKVQDEFDWMYEKVKHLIEKAELDGNDKLQLNGLMEMRNNLQIAMKHLGELNDKVTNIQNIHVKGDLNQIDKMQVMLFEMFEKMDVKEDSGKLIINNPTPEFIMDLRNFKNKIDKKKVELVVDN